MYEQTLYRIIEPVNQNKLHRYNKAKRWEYGYNEEEDIVVISTTGQIGDIYEIQNLKIALPKAPSKIYSRSTKKEEQYWDRLDKPKEFDKIKTIFDWKDYPQEFKNKFVDYIDDEF